MNATRAVQIEEGSPVNAQPALSLRGIRKQFHGNTILDGIDLDVRTGEVVCIVGPSGGGKSTLLRCINHLDPADEGLVSVGGELVGYVERHGRLHAAKDAATSRVRQRLGMVFQQFNLFPHLTALENVTFAPIRILDRKRAEAEAEARSLLRRVGMDGHASKRPSQLSGGQQQRVAIARALAMHPSVMLFDEPTSALDPELVGEVLSVIRALADGGMTMIIVTHEIAFAREIADTVVFMENGRVQEVGPASRVLSEAAQPRTQAFLRNTGTPITGIQEIVVDV